MFTYEYDSSDDGEQTESYNDDYCCHYRWITVYTDTQTDTCTQTETQTETCTHTDAHIHIQISKSATMRIKLR